MDAEWHGATSRDARAAMLHEEDMRSNTSLIVTMMVSGNDHTGASINPRVTVELARRYSEQRRPRLYIEPMRTGRDQTKSERC